MLRLVLLVLSVRLKTKHDLDERTFVCSHCGFIADRDVHAAQNMIVMGQLDKYLDKNYLKAAGRGRKSKADTKVSANSELVAGFVLPISGNGKRVCKTIVRFFGASALYPEKLEAFDWSLTS